MGYTAELEKRQAGYEKIVLITRKTRLAELVERFNTHAQAKFYIEHSGGDFTEYELEDEAYKKSLETVRQAIEVGLKIQVVDRGLLPTLTFLPRDLIVTLGQDGVVANTAKYVGAQPIVAINPDPERFDGVLLPFQPAQTRVALKSVVEHRSKMRKITLALAALEDGQRLLAFNDLFVGAQSHVSARYRIRWQKAEEPQSSSGVLISTGAGCTGWISSVFNMTAGLAALSGVRGVKPVHLDWEDPRLFFVVREPFLSRHSSVGIVAGMIAAGQGLELESLMPSGGVIFSDGVESDYLQFNSGAKLTIRAAAESARLVVG